jgi:MFS family permease
MEQVKNSRAWLIFVIAALGIPYQFYLQSTPGVIIAGLHHSFGLDTAQIGVLTSCFFYTYLALQIPAGIVVDTIGPRRSLLIGMAGCALGCAFFAMAPNYGCAIAARLLMGLSASFFVPAAMTAAHHWHPISRFALLAGMAESIGMAGGALGEEAIGRGVTLMGWRGSMWVSAAAGVLVLLLIAAVVRDNKQAMCCAGKKSLAVRIKEMSHQFCCVVRIPKLWLVALFAALTFGALAAFAGLWVVPYLQLRFGLPIASAAFLGSAIFIGVAVTAPFCGAWYARSSNKKSILRSLTAGAFLLFTGILYLPMATAVILPAMLLLGAFSSVYVLSFGLVPEVVPQHLRGAGVGLVNMGAMLIGAPILQPAIGWWLRVAPQNSAAILAHYQQALSILSVGLFVAIALVSWLPVPQAEPEEDQFASGCAESP